ncbi:glycosyltransferase family 1 protein, partial [Desulfobacterales bacterium HSG17]|nr:glycosyltransferase family 1 protein [Desulfobacterales bacterium HSG17]
MDIWTRKKPSFGFISTRFAGLDGVTLETQKWVDVVAAKGCNYYFMAGQLNTAPDISYLSPKAFFQHPEILDIQNALFEQRHRTPEMGRKIQDLKEELKKDLYQFHSQFKFDILVVQNALAIPVNIPFGLAITEFIIETGIPTIAHHHDFFWERERFNSEAAIDYLRAAFPPIHSSIQHVVINSIAGHAFGRFTGASWTLVPNVLDFKTLPPEMDDYNRSFRRDIGLDNDTLLVLQPTRVVSRKGIETAAELVKRLNHPKACLVISHEAEDEGGEYLSRVEEYVDFIGIDLKLVADRIGERRTTGPDGKKIYTLAEAYLNADLVT